MWEWFLILQYGYNSNYTYVYIVTIFWQFKISFVTKIHTKHYQCLYIIIFSKPQWLLFQRMIQTWLNEREKEYNLIRNIIWHCRSFEFSWHFFTELLTCTLNHTLMKHPDRSCWIILLTEFIIPIFFFRPYYLYVWLYRARLPSGDSFERPSRHLPCIHHTPSDSLLRAGREPIEPDRESSSTGFWDGRSSPAIQSKATVCRRRFILYLTYGGLVGFVWFAGRVVYRHSNRKSWKL